MPTLQEVVQNHLEVNDVSIRALAKEAGITYPTLLGVVNRGSVPRKSGASRCPATHSRHR